MSWLVIGVSGVSCSGKTSLAQSIANVFSDSVLTEKFYPNLKIGQVKLVCQDDYFWPIDHPKHEWVKVNGVDHINREQLSALDMDKMCDDLMRIIGNENVVSKGSITAAAVSNPLNILIIEGFLIFNHKLTAELCQVKICLSISFENCFDRRKVRVYKQRTPPGYFENYTWPLYESHFNEFKNTEGLIIINGGDTMESCTDKALSFIKMYL
ncbi:hypothetical protein HA402_015385 [Bradysia odoriphaga]|nr:hypothetical protein HA402_015385 [Bradysia odoriphaga]